MYLKRIKMKKTRIRVMAYCSKFDIEVSRKDYLGVEEAEKHIRKEIVDTAQVISVTFLLEDKEVTFNNINYKDPNEFINRIKTRQ
jgi:hypothetical protein